MSEQSIRWILAIDTSTEQASIALFDGTHCSEITWPAGRDQTVSVLDQIDHLLTLTKLAVADLSAIGIATGPGMFNGLRVGMSVAKGFALSANLPLIGIPTLEAVALPHLSCGLPIVAVLAAGRGRVLWARYAGDSFPEPRNGTPEELAAAIEEEATHVLLCGEIPSKHRRLFASSSLVHLPPLAGSMRRASAVGELAWKRLGHRDFDNAVTLEPAYLHAASPQKGIVKG